MTSYERYIGPHLLPPVQPLEVTKTDPDEQFFIRTHQVFEVWFSQIIAELEFARSKLSGFVPEHDIPSITYHVKRASLIFNMLREHLPLLESLFTTSFYDFRRRLFGAGGTQSYRYREVEWLLGFRDPDLLAYLQEKVELEHRLLGGVPRAPAGVTQPKPPSRPEGEYESVQRYQQAERGRIGRLGSAPGLEATRAALVRREADLRRNGTLRRRALEWLTRTPYPGADDSGPGPEHGGAFVERFRSRFQQVYREDLDILEAKVGMAREAGERSLTAALARLDWFLQRPERRTVVFVLQFAEQPLLAWPAALLEALLELDEAFVTWRDRHAAMVARVLGGGRISTTGETDSGLPYLHATLHRRVFPEMWDARTFLLGQKEAAGVYSGAPGDWNEWRHFRLQYELLPARD
jgi:tryptophan 2,3-dioxygenase